MARSGNHRREVGLPGSGRSRSLPLLRIAQARSGTRPAMSSRPGGRQNRQQAHQEAADMTGETVSAATIINAPAEAIFAVLADPARHAAIDGTGWVREYVDSTPLIAAGQVFRMAIYHAGHPD